jgi:hypothetical protein
MADEYTLKEVHVSLQPGVTLVAQVDSVAAVKKLMKDLKAADIAVPQAKQDTARLASTASRPADSPERRIEIKAELHEGQLANANTVAFKDGVPELLRPSTWTVTDAVLLLLLALETGLKKPQIDYESFKALYDAQNIKSGSPLSMKLTDLRNDSYLDKKAYAEGRILRLTAKGEKKAIEVLQRVIRPSAQRKGAA